MAVQLHIEKKRTTKIVEINCPSPLNLGSEDVIKVTVVGRKNFLAARIEPMSIRLEGVSPRGFTIDDVASPIGHHTGNRQFGKTNSNRPDGIDDLILEFDAQEIARSLGYLNGDCITVLKLTGQLKDGTLILGEDIVVVTNRDVM